MIIKKADGTLVITDGREKEAFEAYLKAQHLVSELNKLHIPMPVILLAWETRDATWAAYQKYMK